MAIKFECPVCGNPLSAKNAYAGKEGKCKCGAALIVPGNTDRMKFGCRHCGKGISVSNRHAGKNAKCPTCKGVITVPMLGILVLPEEPLELLLDIPEKGVAPGAAAQAMIEATCMMCRTTVLVPRSSAGNIIECAQCGSFMEVPSSNPRGKPSVSESAKVNDDQETIGSAVRVSCPSCKRKLAADAPICTQCGVYVKSGRPILMSWDTDSDEIEEKAEGTVRTISWLIPFGLYPVYSDAIGNHKPFATWGITIATVLVSIWFLVLEYSGSPKMMSAKNLMLWSSKAEPDAEHIQLFYSYGSYGDADAFTKKKEELSQSVPENELDVAALKALAPEQRCFGEYKPFQLITHAFLHGGLMHLAGNMLFLIVLGSRVNSGVGNVLTLVLYPILAVAAAMAHLASLPAGPPIPMLGASGAVMGLAGAYLLLYPVNKVYMVIWMRWGLLAGFHLSYKCFALRGFLVVLFYIIFDIMAVSLTMESSTAHWAHIGGFIVGFVLAFGLLAGRLAYSRSDLFSLVLGKYAWPIIGTPANRMK